MMMFETIVHLHPAHFGEREERLVEHDSLSASVYRFDTGVCALKLENDLGHLLMLPFQGQQIWDAVFEGRRLTMVSMFDEPRATQTYLETYGGFLLHCGATAMGVPTGEDTHPLHGELPNAPYQRAWVVVGEDKGGTYIGLSGQYQHTVAFNCNYVAEPLVKLYAGSTIFDVSLDIHNLKDTEMELMYLAHINFRPVDHARLAYSAPKTPEHVRVRKSIPSHVRPGPGYREFLQELGEHPEKHHVLAPELIFDPELVFNIDYRADETDWAHSLQVHPNERGDYVAHRPDQLPIGVRWICRTPDQDALGLVLPATAEPEGYHAEKAKGNIVVLPGGETFHVDMRVGTLAPEGTAQIEAKIDAILG
jgi:hypothetical protein